MPNGIGPIYSRSYSQQFDCECMGCKTFRQQVIKNQALKHSAGILNLPLGQTPRRSACDTMRLT